MPCPGPQPTPRPYHTALGSAWRKQEPGAPTQRPHRGPSKEEEFLGLSVGRPQSSRSDNCELRDSLASEGLSLAVPTPLLGRGRHPVWGVGSATGTQVLRSGSVGDLRAPWEPRVSTADFHKTEELL